MKISRSTIDKLMYTCIGMGILAGITALTREIRPAEVLTLVSVIVGIITLVCGLLYNRGVKE